MSFKEIDVHQERWLKDQNNKDGILSKKEAVIGSLILAALPLLYCLSVIAEG